MPKDNFFLRTESFYNVSTNIDELDELSTSVSLYASYGGKSLHDHSQDLFSSNIFAS